MARYDAFLLRIWQRGGEPHKKIAVQLRHLPDGDTVRFSNLASLLAHLNRELCAEDQAPSAPDSGDPEAGRTKGGRD